MIPSHDDPWLNFLEYPFRMNAFPCEGLTPSKRHTPEQWINYVDEGVGRPVVFVHGSMTWSFLFRKLIKGLSGHNRCVAIDHLGFGLSSKHARADYSPQAHAARFGRLMDHLNLDDVTLVIQDAGGPIGLSWAMNHPDRVRNIVMMNTFMWSLTENQAATRLANLVGNPINRFYYQALKASPAFILPALLADRHRMSKMIMTQYFGPFRHHKDRRAVYALIESYRKSTAWYEALWDKRAALASKRILLLWGMRDPMFGPEALAKWQGSFPHAETVEFAANGRFATDEAGPEVLEHVRWFLMNHVAVEGRG